VKLWDAHLLSLGKSAQSSPYGPGEGCTPHALIELGGVVCSGVKLDTRCKMQDTRYRIQDTGYKIQDTGTIGST
jgi:hypothetical protein